MTSIGLADWRIRDLRHTYAIQRIRLGVPTKTVSEALGHYSTAFTMDTCTHSTDETQNDAAARMQAEMDRRLRNK